MNTIRSMTLLLMLGAGCALGQQNTATEKPAALSLTPPPDAPPAMPAPLGPYATIIESNPRLADHTVYRPAELAPFTGAKALPVVSWGNGACSNAGLLFKEFLGSIASQGFLVIAAGSRDTPVPDFSQRRAPLDQNHLPPSQTKDEDLVKALDWAAAENQRPGSPYFHHLNLQKVAVMGQSCGGLQAIVASADPRVKTSVIFNSGAFPDGAPQRSISGASKASLGAVHAPIAYLNGGPTDIAYVNAADDVKRLTQVPVFFGWVNVGHGGTFRHPGGGRFAIAATAWLEWRLNGDSTAARLFTGRACGLCTDPVWHVERNVSCAHDAGGQLPVPHAPAARQAPFKGSSGAGGEGLAEVSH